MKREFDLSRRDERESLYKTSKEGGVKNDRENPRQLQ